MKIEYAIIVKGRTRLESLIERFNTRLQAKFYIERSGGDFLDYEREHDSFHTALDAVQRNLSRTLKNKLVDRSFLPSFIFSTDHVVITVGQDGLLANTAKYARGIPLIGVNPDPARYDGVLLPYTGETFLEGVSQVIAGTASTRIASLAEARLNDGQRLLAFNDLFIGISDHTSARYRITYKGATEEQSSSGILVSTTAGSTGWLSSVFNMANGIVRSSNEQAKPKRPRKLREEELFFVVREPFLSQRTKVGLTVGSLNPSVTLGIESLMPDRGVIFSDGIGADHLHFNSGSIATIGLAREKARLVVPGR
jgi:hypothetical protein